MSLKQELDELVLYAEKQIATLAEQKELEQTLAEEMPLRFEQNIKALVKYLPDIAAQFRHYRPKSLKLFCSPSGSMNIIDDDTGIPLYGDDPIQQCREQVDKLIDAPKFSTMAFDMSDDVFNTFIHTKYLQQLYKKYLDAREELELLTSCPDHLGSTIIFGIGLGYHLPILLDDITIDHIYICEPNRDWFFASLYTCDWKHILELIDERDGNIMINIGVSYEQFTNDFINEMKHRGAFNSVNALMYQHYPSASLTKIIKQLNNDFHMVAIGWGFFDDGVISIAHDYHNAKRELPTLKLNAELPKKWRGMPAFVVANGPSFDSVIETLKEHEDKVVIFSCGSAILPLLKHGIIPDFHVALERTRFTYDYYNEFIPKDIIKQINFLTVNVMHPDCADLFKWTGMSFKTSEPGTTISCDFIDGNKTFCQLSYSNPVVANTALAFVANMGFEEVYLMGIDGGYKDPEHHHSKSSSYYNKDGTHKKALTKLIRSGELQVDGNFGGTVFTSGFLNVGTAQLGHLLSLFPKLNCYNCSDGAKIKGATPLHHEDLMLMGGLPNKQEVIEYLKTEQFPNRKHNEQTYLNWLAIDQFNDICDEMIGCIDKEFESRAEIATALKLQVRCLYSYSHTRFRHLYFILDGSITYLHSVFRMGLYGFADEQKTLELMKEMFVIFTEYMEQAKLKYQRVLEDGQDEQRSYLMGMLGNDDGDDTLDEADLLARKKAKAV
jgi:hypothetical protein